MALTPVKESILSKPISNGNCEAIILRNIAKLYSCGHFGSAPSW